MHEVEMQHLRSYILGTQALYSKHSLDASLAKPDRISTVKKSYMPLRTFYDATTCHVSQTNKCPITDDKAPLWRSDLFSNLIDVPMYRLAEVEVAALYPCIREVALNIRFIARNAALFFKLENARMFQYLYPYINSRLLTAAYPPQRHRW
ncbi:hypothetical protein T4C_10749 [Trichinella pseudospiralis]|uniref:Uncharacterized protein n=1 Tax=Trichinella pseudospiralis TaxID=6337 RepID=A0A0V1JQS5_TRIPS|nr:hypothetical protein T4C_10749 [Trichinella pseudospiralis]